MALANMSDRVRLITGWAAVALSTAALCFWAFWGSAEAFHEGWYFRSLWRNLFLTFIQYLAPVSIILIPVSVALRWRRAALPLFLLLAVAAVCWFRKGAGVVLIAFPLATIGTLFYFGRPEPRRWAWRVVLGAPLVTALATGAVPGYRAMTRWDDGNYGPRLVEGNGVRLVWAPEGPGWGEHYASWNHAMERCTHLSADGRELRPEIVGVWRLPSVAEAVQSMVRRGRNAGGVWDAAAGQARYCTLPEKESPLWKRYSQVIYWWTATPDGPENRFRIAYNGYVMSAPPRGWGDYWSYRCVCEVERFTGRAIP
jgi:hypothetical protein